MTTALLTPDLTLFGIHLDYDPATRRVVYKRACSRCGLERPVRLPRAKQNLCRDCTDTLSRAERERWAA